MFANGVTDEQLRAYQDEIDKYNDRDDQLIQKHTSKMSDTINTQDAKRPGTSTSGFRPTSSIGGRIDNVLQVNTDGGYILKQTNEDGTRPKTPMPHLNLEVVNRRREAENRRETASKLNQ